MTTAKNTHGSVDIENIMQEDELMTIYPEKAPELITRAMDKFALKTNKTEFLKLAPVVKKTRLSILGMGYVGAVSAACFADLGHTVIGVDPDASKVESIANGVSPIVEKGLPELLAKAHKRELLDASTNVIDSVLNTDVTFVSVGTPSSPDGACDLTYLRQASAQLGEALKIKTSYHLIVFRSTTPPRTTRDVMIPILEKSSGKVCGKDFGVCFNPEFLRESTAIEDFYQPPKTVIGCFDDRSGKFAAKLYKDVTGELIHTSLEAAEFVKYIDNTWHAVKVSFANEVGRLCKATGVDSHDVMDIFVKDKKLNLSPYYLKPGFAYGGSCLPKDTRGISHLAASLGVDLPLIDSLPVTNKCHVKHAIGMIEKYHPKTVGIVGLTFKSGTDDLRESPSIKLAKALQLLGYKVRYFDPNINTRRMREQLCRDHENLAQSHCALSDTLIIQSDLVVIAHADNYAAKIAVKAKQTIPVIDLVRLTEQVSRDNNYEGICW